jgi:putative holliday junction resolvase
MRVLAIDYGTAKVGLAISDDLGMFATPYKVIPNSERLAEEIAEIIRKEKVERVVLGMPFPVEKDPSPTLGKVRVFRKKLAKVISCPIIEWDEAFSSRRAQSQMIANGVRKKRREQRGTTDLWAASIILQEYLDAQSGGDSRGSMLGWGE